MVFVVCLIALAVLTLAFANGANDNVKGVATLIGSRTMSQPNAIVLAALATFAGSVAAVFLAHELLSRFTGKGIVDASIVSDPAFAASVAIAASLTILLATRLGMPISTTHAIVGSFVGIGAASGAISWSAVLAKFLIPLLISPLIAATLAFGLYLIFRRTRQSLGIGHQTCICVGKAQPVPVTLNQDGSLSVAATGIALTTDQIENCRSRYAGRVLGIEAQRLLDVGHVVSATILSFARGLNDTPKIAAVMVAAGGLAAMFGNGGQESWVTVSAGTPATLIAVGIAIAAGGLLAVKRVTRTMSYRITEMNDGQAFTANIVAAALVLFASRMGMPVSTTHVTCGSLFGIGAANRRGHWKIIGTIALAWIATLPVAALAAWAAWQILGPTMS